MAELPSVESMLYRIGIAPQSGPDLTALAEEQLGRIGAATVPWAVGYFIGDVNPEALTRSARGVRIMYVVLGSVLSILIVLTIWLHFFRRPQSPATARHHLPLAALALSGPCWVVAMRNLYHGFEAMFYVGIPLAIFALMLPRLDRWLGGRVRCGAG